MKITKIFNNNCVATSVNDEEVIVTGLGIGFGKKEGDFLEEQKIEKTFSLVPKYYHRFSQMIDEIDFAYFELTQDIIKKGREEYGLDLEDKLIIFLTDHMASAVKRFEEGIFTPNLMNEEFKLFYPEEFKLAKWAVLEIRKRFDVALPEDEASYITVHLVNGQSGKKRENVQETVELVSTVLEIIETQSKQSLHREDLSVMRFQTHLKYLAQRILSGDTLKQTEKINLKMIFQFKKYQDLVNQISYYIKNRFQYEMTMDEKLYLMIHLDRMLS